jgi:hypothetical protein
MLKYYKMNLYQLSDLGGVLYPDWLISQPTNKPTDKRADKPTDWLAELLRL